MFCHFLNMIGSNVIRECGDYKIVSDSSVE